MNNNDPSPRRILVISLSNIGDVILTFPVLDLLKGGHPQAEITVVVGPKAAPLFKDNPHFRCLVYHKRQSLPETLNWLRALRSNPFDLVVDLRNTIIPFVLRARRRTSPFLARDKNAHMRCQHLRRLRSVYDWGNRNAARYALTVSPSDKKAVERMRFERIGPGTRFVLVAPGAADQAKRWSEEGYAAVCDGMGGRDGLVPVFVGDDSDGDVVRRIMTKMSYPAVDLCGQVTLPQLGALMPGCSLLVTNDSAPLHLGSYCDIPVLALFGPTDPRRYGPWSSESCVIEKKEDCLACFCPKTSQKHTCLSLISPQDVLSAFECSQTGVKFLRPQKKGDGRAAV